MFLLDLMPSKRPRKLIRMSKKCRACPESVVFNKIMILETFDVFEMIRFKRPRKTEKNLKDLSCSPGKMHIKYVHFGTIHPKKVHSKRFC